MRFHIVSLPWTETTSKFEHCAYTTKVRKFCDMMHERGHEVFLYASEHNSANCTKHIQVVDTLATMDFTVGSEAFTRMNGRAIGEIASRIQPDDFLLVIAGRSQEQIAMAFPNHQCVEFGIGYEGTFSDFRVFESYAWMHTIYGLQQGAFAADGKFYDTVIPNYFDVNDFPMGRGQGDFLYIGRHIERKGVQIAADVCRHLDVPLMVAGEGDTPPDYGLLLGNVGPTQRAQLMGAAPAVFVPTLYVEPFGGVAVEAMLCGTPVITTDFGAFTETVIDGVTGFRCHTLREFVDAAVAAPWLDRDEIREHALQYTYPHIGPRYETYFKRLLELRVGNWDTLAARPSTTSDG